MSLKQENIISVSLSKGVLYISTVQKNWDVRVTEITVGHLTDTKKMDAIVYEPISKTIRLDFDYWDRRSHQLFHEIAKAVLWKEIHASTQKALKLKKK